jgi:ERCC4-related helicase
VSSTGRESRDSPIKLLPHQTALVETFFNPESKRVILLRGHVGLGKSAALVILLGRLLQERPAARALFLVPRLALGSQVVNMLRNAGTPSLLVDRYQFREMLDSTTRGELWPSGTVVVLSVDFANQSDIRDSLAKTHWDLVIADEAHILKGNRAEILRKVGAVAKRVVLSTLPDLELPDTFPVEDITVVVWRRDQVVDHTGKPLDTVPRPVLHEVPFSLTPAELSVWKTVSALCRIFEAGTPQQGWISKSLLLSLQSSLAALEGSLQKIAEGLRTQDGMDALLEALDEEVLDDIRDGRMDLPTAEKAAGMATRVLQEIEAIDRDSKLGAFRVLLNNLNEATRPSQRICVLTEYLSTLYYLAAEIEGLELACQLLYGGMSDEDRHCSLTLFSSAGDILVATRAIMTEGLSLHEVTDLVLYDIPVSKIVQQEILGRFDRFGRTSRLNVYVLIPSSESKDVIANPLTTLRELLGAPFNPESNG